MWRSFSDRIVRAEHGPHHVQLPLASNGLPSSGCPTTSGSRSAKNISKAAFASFRSSGKSGRSDLPDLMRASQSGLAVVHWFITP